MSEQQGQTKPDLWQQTNEDHYTLRINISPRAWASALVSRIPTTPESWMAHVTCPSGSHVALSHDCEDPLNEAKQWCEAAIIQIATRTVEDWTQLACNLQGVGDDLIERAHAIAAAGNPVNQEESFSTKLLEQIKDIAAKAKAAHEEVNDGAL